MSTPPKISVIVPFYNAAATLARCLESILANDYPHVEVLCVDDRSTDDGPVIAARYNVQLLQMIHQSGAAAARNLAVGAATGDILYFTDADVIAPPNILERIAGLFAEHEAMDACFGAYTIFPATDNFASVYKNLIHHHTHLTSKKRAATFWCGCGAVRRKSFIQAGGFDESYTAASVEDIELGYRMTQMGMDIRLRTDLRVTHAKHYTLRGLIASDLFGRAIPWTKLMARKNVFRADLNLKINNILSGVLLALFVPTIVAAALVLPLDYIGPALAGALAVYLALNVRIWWFVWQVKGLPFSLLFLLMLVITYLYSVVGFAWGLLSYVLETAGIRKKNGR